MAVSFWLLAFSCWLFVFVFVFDPTLALPKWGGISFFVFVLCSLFLILGSLYFVPDT